MRTPRLRIALAATLAATLGAPGAHIASARQPARSIAIAPSDAAGDGLDGIYYGTELRSQLNFRTNGYEYRTITYTFVFGPGGRVVRVAPGLVSADFEAVLARAAADASSGTGTYALRGGTVDIVWRDGTAASFVYDPARETLSRGRLRLSRVVSPAGYRLAGTYGTERFTNLSLGAGLPATGAAAWHEVTFGTDGRFTTSGGTGVTTSGAQGGGAATSSATGGGTYRVGDYALELQFADGARGTVPFWVDAAEARGASPGWIVVGGTVWLRRTSDR